jgi:hypothetical protein
MWWPRRCLPRSRDDLIRLVGILFADALCVSATAPGATAEPFVQESVRIPYAPAGPRGPEALLVRATVFDGITQHSSEGINFKRRAATVGWKQAVRNRDDGTWDWMANRPIDPR